MNSVFLVIQSGVTRIGNALLGSVQSGISRLYGGDASVVRLTIDGQGNASGQAASGSILVTSGSVIAPSLVSSGTILAASTITGANLSISGSVTAYQNVLGNKLITDGGGTGYQLCSGSQVYAYHATGTAQTSGTAAVTALSASVASGKIVSVMARGVGRQVNPFTSGGVSVYVTGARENNGDGTLVSLLSDQTIARTQAPAVASGLGGLQLAVASGVVSVQAVGYSGQMNWTVYADITISP